MKNLLLTLLVVMIGQSFAGTLDMDTIDNWQIYNGAELVFGGHESPLATGFQGVVETKNFKELIIQFNHCTLTTDDYNRTIEITDDTGKRIVMKKFKSNLGTRMILTSKDLGPLTIKSITLRYREERKNGTDKILGRITFM